MANSAPSRSKEMSASPAGRTVATAPALGTEGNGTKKRQRLKRESREQLLERLRNPQLSLHEAAILLRVCRATVRRYADSGQLPHVRTQGGQRRFNLREVEALYKQLRTKK